MWFLLRWTIYTGMASVAGMHMIVQVVVRGKRRLVRHEKKKGSIHTHLCVSSMREQEREGGTRAPLRCAWGRCHAFSLFPYCTV
jgi:hypothetical protein